MDKFAKALLGDNKIPFNEAADFFVGIKDIPAAAQFSEKTASMLDAPDETGLLEGKFEVSPEQVAALLQNCIGRAMALMQAGIVYRASVRGPAANMARCCFDDWAHKCVIEDLSKRAAVLAGAVHIEDIETPPATTDPVAAVRAMIRGEQELIQSLNELKTVCGENPLANTVSNMASQAQSRMDDMWKFLDPVSPQPTDPAPPMGLEEHEATETPEVAAQESPEFEAAEQSAGTEAPPPGEEGSEPKTAGQVIDMPTGHARNVAKMKSALKGVKATGKAALPAAALGGLAGIAVGAGGQRAVDDAVARAASKKTAAPLLLTGEEAQQLQGFTQRAPNLVGEIREGVQGYRDSKEKRDESRVAGGVGGAALGAGALMAARKSPNKLVKGLGYAAPLLGGAAGAAGTPYALGHPQAMKETATELRKDLGEMRGMSGRMQELQQLSNARMQQYLAARQAAQEKQASMRLAVALHKLANPDALMHTEEGAMSTPTDSRQLEPSNYMAAELAGRQAQEQNESAFYRQKAQEAASQAAAMNEQLASTQQQMEQLQMQASDSGTQIQQTAQQAMAAQDEALKQTQIAANMRMGIQKMRAQLMELASQDPAQMAAQELQAGPAGPAGEPAAPGATGPDAGMEGGPPPQEGPAGQPQPDGGALPPGAAPPNGGLPQAPAEQAAGGMPGAMDMGNAANSGGLKVANAMAAIKSRLPYALAGAGLGAVNHMRLRGAGDDLAAKVEELEQRPGSFAQALRLSSAKAELGGAERAEEHPGMSLAYNAGLGALGGAVAGPAIAGNINKLRAAAQ